MDQQTALCIENFIKDKTLLITGGGGSVGRVLCRYAAGFKPKKIIIADICENNAYMVYKEISDKNLCPVNIEILSVTNQNMLNRLFRKYSPDIVYHAAAHKHVSLMEHNVSEAVINNVFGTQNVINAAVKYNTDKVIVISTDKAINPVSVMGETKKVCEMIAILKNKQSDTMISSVRFGNIAGSDGSVIPIFKKQIETGGPVTVTDPNCTRYFMDDKSAVKLLLCAGALSKGGEIFALNMDKPKSIINLAEDMIKEKGLVPYKDIKISMTGILPGERLHEENPMDINSSVQTCIPGVYKTSLCGFDEALFIKRLSAMEKYAKNLNDGKLRGVLSNICAMTFKNSRNVPQNKTTNQKGEAKYNIPVFIPHLGCPHACSFCNQTKITGISTKVSCDDVRKIINDYLSYIPKSKDGITTHIEVAFFGGSFTGLPLDEQEAFLKTAAEYKEQITGLRMSTRPDYINDDVLKLCKKYNVTTIELGIQSSDDTVLSLNRRGHTFDDAKRAAKLIKSYDIDLGVQVMAGMYGSTPKKDIETAKSAVALGPVCARIYPTLTLKDTELESLFTTGKYTPYTIEDAIDTTDKMMKVFEDANVDIIRVGLHSDESLTQGNIVAGPYHPAFKELVISYRLKNIIEDQINDLNIKNRTYCVNTDDISKTFNGLYTKEQIKSWIIGHNRCNLNYFKKKYNITIKIN